MKRIRRLLLMDAHTCPWWFGYSFDNPLRRLVHDPSKILGELVGEGDTAADVGCGLGYFTIALARLVGADGRVVALDIQSEMLTRSEARAKRRGLEARIEFRLSGEGRVGLSGPMDFILAFWMVHEVSRRGDFLAEVHAALKPEGRFLLVEPKVHVSGRLFEEILSDAKAAGFSAKQGPPVWFSRSAVLTRKVGPGDA